MKSTVSSTANHTNVARRATFAILLSSVALLAACAPTATREGTGEYVDDSVITAKVKAALLADASLKSAEINVETFKGRVQLSGFVSSAANIKQAAAVASKIKGVTSVTNDMQLK